jgi:hypothetical protein
MLYAPAFTLSPFLTQLSIVIVNVQSHMALIVACVACVAEVAA